MVRMMLLCFRSNVLIDLTADTITANKILDGYTAHDKSGAVITGTCTNDVNSQDATAAVLLFNPVDLRGIPTANADKTLAVWLRPQIFQIDAGDDTINILLLDEISAAPQSVQAAAYQITLDRTIGEHKLPENCIVIAAGNRVTDKSVAYNMPRALANRLLHIEVKGDADSWHDWAVSAGIHPYVISYLEYNPTALPLYSFLIKNRVSLCPSFHQALSPSTGCKVNRGTYFFGVSMFANPA